MASNGANNDAHLAGHIGHLSPDEASAFADFKKLCSQHGLCHTASSADGDSRDGIDDDGTLLRFLRARRFNVQSALRQFEATVSWRQMNNLPFLYDHIDINDFDFTKNLYTHWTGRQDKRGIPVYVFEVKYLTSTTMAAYEKSCISRPTPMPKPDCPPSTPVKMLRLFATYEHLTRFVMPLCSVIPNRPNSETPITSTMSIIDISGVGLLQFWSLKSHLALASELATAHYPETLGQTFVIGAPSFFPVVWGWIKGWFDPITTSKISILSAAEVFPVLSNLIEPCNIPKKYGGDLEFKHGMPPILDPGIIKMIKWSDMSEQAFPIGPVKWKENEQGNKIVVAVGSLGGKERREVVGTLQESHEGKDELNGIALKESEVET